MSGADCNPFAGVALYAGLLSTSSLMLGVGAALTEGDLSLIPPTVLFACLPYVVLFMLYFCARTAETHGGGE